MPTDHRISLRGSLLLAVACTLASFVPANHAAAQAADNKEVSQTTSRERILVKAKKRLLREKNSPSAVTELGEKQISATGVAGSVGTLLRQAPSVYVYQQGLGDSAPELTIRGIRGLEIASTLDGVPTQDLQAPGNFYLANNIGGVFTLNQIEGVHIYPGVAYPDKNTFGTIGGTIAYDSKRPSNDFFFDVTGTVGSFGTYREGFDLNTGAFDSPLGTGDNAAKLLLSYENFQSSGFIQNTNSRENEMEFAFDKPYNDGLSKFQATVLFNTGNGLIQNEPVPVPYLDKYGRFSNYPTSDEFVRENNDYLTVFLKDRTYVNDWLTLGGTVFYIANDQQTNSYANINLLTPGGSATPLSVGPSNPFFNTPGGFGDGGEFGPPVGGLVNGVPTGYQSWYFGQAIGYGGLNPAYNPYALYPIGSKYCPRALTNQYAQLYGDPHFAPCGLNDQVTGQHSDTYGVQPYVEILPPDIWGVVNSIKIGGLAAKETSPTGYDYLGGAPNTPQTAAHSAVPLLGGTQRTIYQAYAQDKIDLLDGTLHITPGITVEGTSSSLDDSLTSGSLASPEYGANGFFGPNGCGTTDYAPTCTGVETDPYGPYKGSKWDRDFLPFFNIAYDFDKIVPSLAGLTAYGSTGTSALFAPTSDFGPSVFGSLPDASIVHMYEGGLKYNTSNLLISADYFYQKIDRDFGSYSNQNPAEPGYGDVISNNNGQREFKGVEVAVQYQITPNIQLFGNASHILAHYLAEAWDNLTVAQDQYGVVQKGNPITGIPDWVSTFGIDYTRKSSFIDDDVFSARLTDTYTGHQYTTYDLNGTQNIQGLPGVPYGGPNGAYNLYQTLAGATTYDPNGGIKPNLILGVDLTYVLPTPQLPVLKSVKFNLNIQNLFNTQYWQYFYRQISPTACGSFTSGPYAGLAKSSYGCTPEFADGIPGEPFGAFFSVTARF
jgi:iron complex outermembrane receptor protein